ncbi:phosphotransferase [Paenibacillus lupini]|uniref:phosphotransferase enzyme family protein n=1 Tax=Paenibacillus lupini TaxID=1450204 RepID=UPI0014214060|nr:phosphotransferase [Paenibacillus lupini]NIK21236.1 Ser/Thr protein kinase RdoA (MazF antagonist) [Paenibacillus lupini]
MNSGFLMDTDHNRHNTLRQTKRAALFALQEYELVWDSIHFIQVSEHVTFRIDCGEGDKYLLRIHSGNKSAEATLSELEWLNHLGRKEIIVPNGVMNREISLITTLPDEDGQTYYATLLRWVEGERLDKWSLTDEHIQQMGMLMADLHTGSSDFAASRDFTRPHWGSDSFKRDWEHLQRHHHSFITDEAFQLYTIAAVKVANLLDTFVAEEQDYGMIHADLHSGNVVFHHGKPYAIDFGRCGYGFHMYDIAQAVMGLRPTQRRLFIEGYEKVRLLSSKAISMLECFFIMSIIEAYSFHAENELETEGLIEEQPYARAILNAYLNGEPFLFQVLDE